MELDPVVVVAVRALGMVVQVWGPVHALLMAEYIRGRAICLLEPASSVDRLDILPELVLTPGISLLLPRELRLQLLSHFSKCISPTRHLCIPSRDRLSIWASRAEVQEANTGVDRVVEDSHSLPVLSRLAEDRQGCSL